MAKSAKQSVTAMLSRIWQEQWLTLNEYKVGAALGDDPRQLHRLRVALRQTRALLRAFTHAWPHAKVFSALFKWLAAATSTVRHFDVLLINLHGWVSTCEPKAEEALLPIVAQLTK